jgi:MATE family, multidrug efflux pump
VNLGDRATSNVPPEGDNPGSPGAPYDEAANPGEPHHDPAPAAPHLVDLTRPAWRLVLTLAWPVFLQQMLNVSVNLFDRWLAGHYRPDDVTYQAVQTTAQYLVWSLYTLALLVTVGATALVAHFVGAGDWRSANRVTHQAMILAGVFGAVSTVAGLMTVDRMVTLLGVPGDDAAIAADYLRPILLLLTFQMIEQAGIACLIGAGDTKTGMWVLGGVALLNMPLAWLFRDGLGPIPPIGFAGIALGTAVSHTLGCVAVLAVLCRGRAGLRLHLGRLRPDAGLLRRMLRVSLPATVDALTVCLCQLWFLTLVNSIGKVPRAAHGIAIGWEALGYLSGQVFATAATALVGQNLGAKRPDRAAHCGWVALAIGGAVMIVMGAIFYTFAPEMFRLFNPSEKQAAVIEAGVPVLRLVAFAMPSLACIIIVTGALRGAGDTRLPLLLTWIGFLVIRIPLAYLLMYPSVDLGSLGVVRGFDMGLYGAWLAMFADLSVRGVCFLLRFATGGWQRVKV